MKIQNTLVSNMLDRSQRYFAHVTTVTLSWRVQNIVVIDRVYFTRECFEFSSNFEFDRNMLSGTGARTCPFQHSQYHGCWWAGDARHQGISNHDIDLIKPRWLSRRTLRVKSNVLFNPLAPHPKITWNDFNRLTGYQSVGLNMTNQVLLYDFVQKWRA